jgi:hypothetical protein
MICSKIVQNMAKQFFCQNYLIHIFSRGSIQTKNLGFFCNFKKYAQSKQSPNLVTLITT